MGVLMCVVGIGIVCFCFPYIRCFFKRLSMLSKIKNACWEKGYRLQGTHAFWFLGGKNGKNCDCIIETAEDVFVIKLFGMPRRKRVLVFTEKKEYFTRILVGMLLLIRESFDSKAKQLPEYDFVQTGKAASSDKKLRKILLVNPVPMEMLWQAEKGKETKLSPFPMENMQKENGKERILSPGDVVYDMELANLSWFLKELR
ncbi:MAG: hypothetical protein J6K04_06170 [Lachnospiraceae bacterium]|nr:hypothetical protein [Lachnospiraceae bacterium]MBP3568738.1 hypothetical protein [Lachnospiraceae bacterium]